MGVCTWPVALSMARMEQSAEPLSSMLPSPTNFTVRHESRCAWNECTLRVASDVYSNTCGGVSVAPHNGVRGLATSASACNPDAGSDPTQAGCCAAWEVGVLSPRVHRGRGRADGGLTPSLAAAAAVGAPPGGR